ncbi:betaine/carnitine transporter, BCCT family/L-carnitine/gamma-butyrobetaine antiporter, partial [Desulfocicer vacuolatum DSM 3385]
IDLLSHLYVMGIIIPRMVIQQNLFGSGLSRLGDIRVYFGFGTLLVLLVLGPTSFMFNNFVDSLGIALQNFTRMSLYIDATESGGFPQGWSIFYWAWSLAVALQFGIYLARISKGRSVREFLIGGLTSMVIGNWLFFLIIENTALDIFRQGLVPVAEILSEQGLSAATVALWNHFPLGGVVLVAFLVLGFINTSTMFNSIAYALAMMTTKGIKADEEPSRWLRVFWSVAVGCFALALLFIGGLKTIKTATTVGSLPTVVIMVFILISFFKMATKKWPNYSPSKE